ncbi:alpha/beta fold hydrolase [Nocardiopsis lambiniae]|uniref:Alpha/beta fold hydrolase n=1 Tax=Nocardiopsis lambiniae TaxID=3075539 RepID=A0ABU2M7A3_9ACTN|nr:alpha/beta fold hydrolase [Nocardiopsis sp. DSM 44743]MDT0328531.1 alpha/beta fold hydrolase [Nocardiopsis sp. DSM 44743]
MRTAPVLTCAGTLVLALASSLAVAAPAAADDPLRAFHEQEVVWSPCEEHLLRDVECAWIDVPLDYADPGGERASIAISRNRASDPERRRGILLTNPGGPGGTGRQMAVGDRPDHGFSSLGAQRVAEVYDVIGMDPRGSGASTPYLDCGAHYPVTDPRPTDDALSGHTRAVIAAQRACESAHGGLIPHMTTESTARDMDVIRAALGEEQISYLGRSYGTYLGAVYGSLFPQRLDRSVLDAAVPPEGMWRDVFTLQSEGDRANVERYTAWVAEHDDVYGLGSTPEEVLAVLEETRARLVESPRHDQWPDDPEPWIFTADHFDSQVGHGARFQEDWGPSTAVLWYIVNDLPYPEVEWPEDPEWPEEPEWPDPGIDYDNVSLMMAVLCEAEWPTRLSDYYADVREVRERSPYGVGAIWHVPQPCTFASHTPAPLVELEREGYPRGLVIGGEYDANTVYEGAERMADRLDNALITVTDEGDHTFYGREGMDCVTAAVDAYLVDGVPAGDARCAGRPRSEDPLDPQEEMGGAARVLDADPLRDPLRAGPISFGISDGGHRFP